MKKKLLAAAILISACMLAFSACDNAEETLSPGEISSEENNEEVSEKENQEETNQEEDTQKEPDEEKDPDELSVEERLISLWRLDLPEVEEGQAVHDDTVNNTVTYFPDTFKFAESSKNGKTVLYTNDEDSAQITISFEENSNGFTLEEFAQNVVNNDEGLECEVKYTGSNAFKLTGSYPEDERCVALTGVIKDGKLFTLKVTYPESLSDKYDLPENEIFIMVNGLDEDGNEIVYDKK